MAQILPDNCLLDPHLSPKHKKLGRILEQQLSDEWECHVSIIEGGISHLVVTSPELGVLFLKVLGWTADKMESLVEQIPLWEKRCIETIRHHLQREPHLILEDGSLKFAVGFGFILSEVSRKDVHMRISSSLARVALFWDELEAMDDASRELENRLLDMVESAEFEELDDHRLRSVQAQVPSLSGVMLKVFASLWTKELGDYQDQCSTSKTSHEIKPESGDSPSGQPPATQLKAPLENRVVRYGKTLVINAHLASEKLKDILAHVFTVLEPKSGIRIIIFTDDDMLGNSDGNPIFSIRGPGTGTVAVNLIHHFNNAYDEVSTNPECRTSLRAVIWRTLLIALFHEIHHSKVSVAAGDKEVVWDEAQDTEATKWAIEQVFRLGKFYPALIEPPKLGEDPFFGPLITDLRAIMNDDEEWQQRQRKMLDEGSIYIDGDVTLMSMKEYLRLTSDDKDSPDWTPNVTMNVGGEKTTKPPVEAKELVVMEAVDFDPDATVNANLTVANGAGSVTDDSEDNLFISAMGSEQAVEMPFLRNSQVLPAMPPTQAAALGRTNPMRNPVNEGETPVVKEEKGAESMDPETAAVPFISHLEFLGYEVTKAYVTEKPECALYLCRHPTRMDFFFISIGENLDLLQLRCTLNLDSDRVKAQYDAVLRAINRFNGSSFFSFCYIADDEFEVRIQTVLTNRYSKIEFGRILELFQDQSNKARVAVAHALEESGSGADEDDNIAF